MAVHLRCSNTQDGIQAHLWVHNRAKKPKVSEQRTYIQVTSNLIKVATVPVAYCDRKFEEEKEAVLFKWSIEGHILDLVMGIKAPTFQHQVVVHVQDPEMTAKEALELPDRLNEGLVSHEGVIMRGSESRDATSSHFAALIGYQPLEALKALNFRPYCRLHWATVQLPAKGCKGNNNEKGDTLCYYFTPYKNITSTKV
jgi:hypothetical protein